MNHSGDKRKRQFARAVARIAPSVVAIETVGGENRRGKLLFGSGPTSGIIVAPEGYILSSAFNFLRKPDSILVTTPSGKKVPATVVATDHNRMLTLLKINASESLPIPPMASKADMRVGQWAIAVGRTFDIQSPNVAVGIVSALSRIWGKAIQTDAAVSPSNYGGALVDIHGRLMGILVPLSPDRHDEIGGVEWYDSGIGFAIPAEDFPLIVPRMKEGRDLEPGFAGIGFSKASLLGGEAIVDGTVPNSPAAKAGISKGDAIVECDGRTITKAYQVKECISRRYAGDSIRLVLNRAGVRFEKTLALTIPPKPGADENPHTWSRKVRREGKTMNGIDNLTPESLAATIDHTFLKAFGPPSGHRTALRRSEGVRFRRRCRQSGRGRTCCGVTRRQRCRRLHRRRLPPWSNDHRGKTIGSD